MPADPDPSRLDVDVRFLLANERTLLAWVRTALTLLIAGAGVEQFASDLPLRSWWAAVLIGLGVAAAVTGAGRHAGADRAIRHGALPSAGYGHYLIAGAVALVGIALLAALVADNAS